jgi:hypothetical protein
MSELKSPLGNRSMPQATAPRIFTVEDTSGQEYPEIPGFDDKFDQSKFRESLNQETIDRLNGKSVIQHSAGKKEKQQITQPRKSRLEALLGLRTETKTITINDVPIQIRTLYTSEQKEINQFINSDIDLQLNICARCVVSINDEPLTTIVGSKNVEDIVAFFEESHYVLVQSIYANYIIFARSVNEVYGKNITMEQLSKEVGEDIKKA